jgi:hypothetical protein
MFSSMHRRLGLWLAGLFVIAQIFGVVSLISSHIAHVAEAELAFSDSGPRSENNGHRHHYRGAADGVVQHHELHDLSGAFLGSGTQSDVVFLPVKINFVAARALPESDPIRLERPPKTFLSI